MPAKNIRRENNPAPLNTPIAIFLFFLHFAKLDEQCAGAIEAMSKQNETSVRKFVYAYTSTICGQFS